MSENQVSHNAIRAVEIALGFAAAGAMATAAGVTVHKVRQRQETNQKPGRSRRHSDQTLEYPTTDEARAQYKERLSVFTDSNFSQTEQDMLARIAARVFYVTQESEHDDQEGAITYATLQEQLGEERSDLDLALRRLGGEKSRLIGYRANQGQGYYALNTLMWAATDQDTSLLPPLFYDEISKLTANIAEAGYYGVEEE